MADDPEIPEPPAAEAPAKAKKAKGAKKPPTKASGTGAAGLNQVNAWVGWARAWGGVVGFALATLLARMGGMPWSDAMLRGLVGALILSFTAWWCTLLIFRGLISSVEQTRREMAEMRRQQERERARQRMESGGGFVSSDAEAPTEA